MIVDDGVRLSRRTLPWLACALTALLIGLTGCAGPGQRSGSSAPEAAPATAPDSGGARRQSPTAADRKEVVTGTVAVTSGDPVGLAHQVVQRVGELGGRIDNRTERPGTDSVDPQASLTLRVPADKTDRLIDDLRGLGRVTSVQITRDDVTLQADDLDARIRALRASVDRLLGLIANASNPSDVIEAEKAISDRQGELDSLSAQQRRLNDQIALSTLTVEITTDEHPPRRGPGSFWSGLVAGWHSLVDWLAGALVVVGRSIPWLGFLALLGLIGLGLARLLTRRPKPSPANRAEQPQETAGRDG